MSSKLTNIFYSIKEWWKRNKGIISLILIIIFVAAILVFATKILRPDNDEIPNLTLSPTKQYEDNSGRKYAETPQQEVDKEIVKKLVDSLKLKFKNSGEVRTVTQYVYKTDTIFRKVPVYINDDSSFSISKKDNYIDLEVIGSTKSNTADISLSLKDTLVYTDRTIKHLFKSNERIVSIRNSSPYASTTEALSITVKERKPLLSLGAGVVYNPFTQKPQYGVGVFIPIISIKSSK